MSHFVRFLRFSLRQFVLSRDFPHHPHHWLLSEETPVPLNCWVECPSGQSDPRHGKKLETIPVLQLEIWAIWKVLASNRIPKWHCTRRLWNLCTLNWTMLVCIPDDWRKNNECHCKITKLWRTSSWCNICQYLNNIVDAPKLLKFPKSECADVWIRLPRHKWPKSWDKIENPVVPVERSPTWTRWNFTRTWMGEIMN